jgi:hypothetical protein
MTGRGVKMGAAGSRSRIVPERRKARREAVSGPRLTLGAVGLALRAGTVHAEESSRESPDSSQRRGRRRRSNRPGNSQAKGTARKRHLWRAGAAAVRRLTEGVNRLGGVGRGRRISQVRRQRGSRLPQGDLRFLCCSKDR